MIHTIMYSQANILMRVHFWTIKKKDSPAEESPGYHTNSQISTHWICVGLMHMCHFHLLIKGGGPIYFIFMQFSGTIWPANGLEPPTLGLVPPSGKFWILHSFILRLLILQQWYNPYHWVFGVFWFGEAIICLECIIMSIEEESKLSHIPLLCFI